MNKLIILLVAALTLCSSAQLYAGMVDLTTPDALKLSCANAKVAADLCSQLKDNLPSKVSDKPIAASLDATRVWLRKSSTRAAANTLLNTLGARANSKNLGQLVDLGVAYIVLGRVGEGFYNLLQAYQLKPAAPTSSDLAYLGLLLHWDELDQVQRVDWSADLAGRIVSNWPKVEGFSKNPPRLSSIVRVAHLYSLAGEEENVAHVTSAGMNAYPESSAWRSVGPAIKVFATRN